MSAEQPKHFSPEDKLTLIIKKLADHHRITLTEETLANTNSIASACGIADDEVDRCKDPKKRRTIVQNAFNYLSNGGELPDTESLTFEAYQESMSRLKGLVDSMSPTDKDLFLMKLRIWDRLSEEQKTQTDVDKSVRSRQVDLNTTAGIYLSAIPKEERVKSSYHKFLKDFKKMVRIAGMLDDAMDMPDDYANRITPIEPTLVNRARLVGTAVRDGVGMMSYAFSSNLLSSSVDIMEREFRRRTTGNNYEQYTTVESPQRQTLL